MIRVVVVGGSGAFGQRLCARLCERSDFQVVVAGRDRDKAGAAARALAKTARHPIDTACLDATSVTGDALAALGATLVINASGPFQASNYALAEAAIAAHMHYVDLADDRRFVTGITKLDDAARDRRVSVISGASSVPGLSSTVFEYLAKDLVQVEAVEIAISPGADFDPGLATTQSVLRGIGRVHSVYQDGNWHRRFGWQDLSRRPFGALGNRWLANVDVPDLSLIPDRRDDIQTVRFQAGLEIGMQHLGLWALSGLTRAGLLKNPERLATPLLKLRRWTKFLGSDRGGMRIAVTGDERSGARITKCWTLTATNGHGPYVPTLASAILAKAISSGNRLQPGAYACYDLFSYTDIKKELSGLSISCTIERRVC